MDLFFKAEKCQRGKLVCIMIAVLQKSTLKIGLLRFHQLLQCVSGVVNTGVAGLSGHAEYKKHKGK